jgi:hypothetical protein
MNENIIKDMNEMESEFGLGQSLIQIVLRSQTVFQSGARSQAVATFAP